MDYKIEVLDKMRYPTCGDYYKLEDNLTKIEIKKQLNEDYEFLIMVHELIEEYITRKRGITEQSITNFDLAWEELSEPKEDEPGNNKWAPYYKEHRFSENIERLICAELGIDWFKYEKDLIV
jgi:hypothetical protein